MRLSGGLLLNFCAHWESWVLKLNLSYLADVSCPMSAWQSFLYRKEETEIIALNLLKNYMQGFCCFPWLCPVLLWILHVKELLNLLLKQLLVFWQAHSVLWLCFSRNLANGDVVHGVFLFDRPLLFFLQHSHFKISNHFVKFVLC